jgi:WD40 repeat protein
MADGLHDAFISYRHVWRDRWWAKWLHRRLERYRTPKTLLAGGTRKRLTRVFRDEEELAASPNLSQAIRAELDASRFLIVICSPHAAASQWVDAEIRHFQATGRGDRILTVLVRGTPETALPPALRQPTQVWTGDEPLAARLPTGLFRYFGRRLALLKILAPLLDCRFDDLRQRDQQRKQRRTAVASAAAALVLALAALSGWNYERRQIEALAAYSRDNLDRDSSRSLLLGRVTLARERRLERIAGSLGRDESVRAALESAIVRDRLRREFRMPASPVQAVAWDDQGRILAGDNDGNVRAWFRSSGVPAGGRALKGGIQRMALHVDGQSRSLAMVTGKMHRRIEGAAILDMGDGARDLHVLDLVSGALRSASLSTGRITPYEAALSWCERDDRIAASSGTKNAWIWLAGAGALQRAAELPPSGQEQIRWGAVNALAWNRGCGVLAVGTSQGLYLWNAATGAERLVAQAQPSAANISQDEAEGFLALDWNPDGTMMAVGGQDSTVRLFDADGQARQVLSGHQGPVKAVRWNRAGDHFATAGADGVVRVWTIPEFHMQYQTVVGFYANQGTSVAALTWSPDGTELASVGEDSTVRVWDVTTITQNVRLRSGDGELRMDSEGRLTVNGRRLTDYELEELARQRSVRPLSSQECQQYLHTQQCPDMP